MIQSLKKEGGSLLNSQEKDILKKSMWNDNGIINRDIIAKKSNEIASLAGLGDNHLNSKFFLTLKQTRLINYYFVMICVYYLLLNNIFY